MPVWAASVNSLLLHGGKNQLHEKASIWAAQFLCGWKHMSSNSAKENSWQMFFFLWKVWNLSMDNITNQHSCVYFWVGKKVNRFLTENEGVKWSNRTISSSAKQKKYADLQLIFINETSEWGEMWCRMSENVLTVSGVRVGWFEYFRNCLLFVNCSLNDVKNIKTNKQTMSSNSVGENALLMTEVR